MGDKRALRDRLTRTVLDGPATTPRATRRAAAANAGLDDPRSAFVEKVTRAAFKITDADVAQLVAAGVSEDEIFELAVAASIGEATRQLDAALTALAATPE